MPIQLSQLLELSHDLAIGRKRRCEWETCAEKISRHDIGAAALHRMKPESEFSCPADLWKDNVLAADMAEMKFLGQSLRAEGLKPRSPVAESAFLRLLCADPKSMHEVKIEGSDLEWLNLMEEVVEEEKIPRACMASCLKAVEFKDKAPTFADDTFARLLEINASSSDDAEDPFVAPSKVLNAVTRNRHEAIMVKSVQRVSDLQQEQTGRLPDALQRLREIVSSMHTPGRPEIDSEANDEDDAEKAARALLIEEMSEETMIEVERHELSEFLVEVALDIECKISH